MDQQAVATKTNEIVNTFASGQREVAYEMYQTLPAEWAAPISFEKFCKVHSQIVERREALAAVEQMYS